MASSGGAITRVRSLSHTKCTVGIDVLRTYIVTLSFRRLGIVWGRWLYSVCAVLNVKAKCNNCYALVLSCRQGWFIEANFPTISFSDKRGVLQQSAERGSMEMGTFFKIQAVFDCLVRNSHNYMTSMCSHVCLCFTTRKSIKRGSRVRATWAFVSQQLRQHNDSFFFCKSFNYVLHV